MRKFLSILFFLSLISTAGCGRSEKISTAMDSWKGSHQSQLIRSWGPPTLTHSDGKGGQILEWRYERGSNKTTATTVPNTQTTIYRHKSKSYASRMFWVDEEGIIYYWSWKGW